LITTAIARFFLLSSAIFSLIARLMNSFRFILDPLHHPLGLILGL